MVLDGEPSGKQMKKAESRWGREQAARPADDQDAHACDHSSSCVRKRLLLLLKFSFICKCLPLFMYFLENKS